jgi:hypothetical protein
MNNPPAFPRPYSEDDVDGHCYKAHVGMTLRDYFAAKAMQAAITGCATRAEVGLYSDWAGFAYEMADAMLKAREQ